MKLFKNIWILLIYLQKKIIIIKGVEGLFLLVLLQGFLLLEKDLEFFDGSEEKF